MKYLFDQKFLNSLIYASLLLLVSGCISSPEIKVQSMLMNMPKEGKEFKEELLPGEIADTKIEHIAYAGPFSKSFSFNADQINMLLFLKGQGSLNADSSVFELVPESIAIPFSTKSFVISVPAGDTLHFVQFIKKISAQDEEDMKAFPAKNKYNIFFTRFVDCEAYTEKIKSPNTVSRTVLPADIVPRVSLGTVETIGPDAVGAHEHPMLDQLFLGLTDNDVNVFADEHSTKFKAFDLLHIPIGSSHGVSVEENKKLYYMWMDFFLTKEGQEWLKTHKPVSKDYDE